jgi:hypothetical protein
MMNEKFRAKLQKSSRKGGWTYVIWPESAKFFGTKGLVKSEGHDRGACVSRFIYGHGEWHPHASGESRDSPGHRERSRRGRDRSFG